MNPTDPSLYAMQAATLAAAERTAAALEQISEATISESTSTHHVTVIQRDGLFSAVCAECGEVSTPMLQAWHAQQIADVHVGKDD